MENYKDAPRTNWRTMNEGSISGKKRIGVVRPDPHGLLYAYCMQECRRSDFLDCGGQIYIMDNGFIPSLPLRGVSITGVCREMTRPSPNWKPEEYKAANDWCEKALWTPENFAKCFECPIYDTVEEMANPELFDGIMIGNCSWKAEDHVELAMPFIKAGIPIFIDKPFANNARDAARLLNAAREYNTPIFSSSILYFDDIQAELARKNLGRAHMLIASFERPLAHRKGSVHLLSTLLGAMRVTNGHDHKVESIRYIGNGAPAMSRDEAHHDAYCVTFDDGTLGILNAEGFGEYGFEIKAFCERGTATQYSEIPAMRGGIIYIAQEFVNMMYTKNPPLDYDRLFEIVAVLDAGIRSRDEGREVTLDEIAAEVGWVYGGKDHDPDAERFIPKERGGRG